ncbi:MAG: putative rane protein [Verrucomicrobiaceae bacterium]|nr:putative rane protein [Verrucomicrobiaceae bacterium]
MSPETATIVFPFIAAVVYVFSALLLKRSSEMGVGLWRTTFVANMTGALLFSLLWLLGGKEVQPALLWQPAIIALCLFAGQLMQFMALEQGDVSVAVPVFGLKVMLVALFAPCLTGETVGLRLWLGAFLCVLGLTFFNRKDEGVPPRNLGITLLSGGLGALCFAIFDVLVAKWGPAWGAGRLLPLIFWINGIFSLSLIFKFNAPLRQVAKGAWPWLLMGSALLSTQSILFVSTLAKHSHATTANIVYSSRGLLTVGCVWLIGHWFGIRERHTGAKVMRWRLVGALMMLSAIALVIMK